MNSFETINLERGMYSHENLSDILEKLDPSDQYVGTAMEGLDAFSRQLKRFDIKVSGAGSDTVEKFFQTGSTSVLFPEFVRRCVQCGMDTNNVLPEIIASTSHISSLDYRSIGARFDNDDQMKVSTKENLCLIRRRGRTIAASYESLRFQRLDLFSTMLKQIGTYIANAQFVDAVLTIFNGDGNHNPATVLGFNQPSLVDWLCMVHDFDGFTVTTVLASPDVARQVIAEHAFRDRISFGTDGVYYLPFNIHMLVSKSIPERHAIFLDRRAALEMVRVGGIEMDYDKLIERQLERAAITCSAGFSKIYDNAMKVLRYKE